MPTQEGYHVTRCFPTAGTLQQGPLGRVLGVDLYPLFGYKFLGRVNDKKIQSCCLDDPPHTSNRSLSKLTRQTDGWPVPKALQGRVP